MSRHGLLVIRAATLVLLVAGFLHHANQGALSHNVLSNLLPAIAPQHGLGVPYRDYWDLYPPGGYLLLGVLHRLGLTDLPILKVLHFLMTVWLSFFAVWCVRVPFERPHLQPAACLTAFFLASAVVNNVLFSNTLIAATLSTLGLYLAAMSIPAASSRSWLRMSLEVFLMTFAGLVKDPFLPAAGFAAAVMIAPTDSSPLKKRVAATISGAVLAVSACALYLASVGAWDAFVETSRAKNQIYGQHAWLRLLPPWWLTFSFSGVFRHLTGERVWLIIAILAAGCLSLFRRSARDALRRLFGYRQWLLGGYLCGTLAGFAAQGKRYNYALVQIIPVLLPLTAVALDSVLSAFPMLTIRNAWARGGLIAALLFPAAPLRDDFARQILVSWREAEGARWTANPRLGDGLSRERLPAPVFDALLRKGSLFVAYGWGAPSDYFDLGVKPFMRYFIPNEKILSGSQRQDWRALLSGRHPTVVRYLTEETDMDVQAFESRVFDLKELLDRCYDRYGSWYVLREPSRPTVGCS